MGIRHDKDDIYMLHGGVVRNQVGAKGPKNLCVFFAFLLLLRSFYTFIVLFLEGGGGVADTPLTLQHDYCTEGQYPYDSLKVMTLFCTEIIFSGMLSTRWTMVLILYSHSEIGVKTGF